VKASQTARWASLLAAAVVLVTVGACSSAATTAPTNAPATQAPTAAPATAAPTAAPVTPAPATAAPTEAPKKALRIMSSNAEDNQVWNRVLKAFTDKTGIEVINEASPDFEVTLQARVAGGDPPDVAVFPQPGLMRDFTDKLVDLKTVYDMGKIKDEFGQGIIDLGMSADGSKFLGLNHIVINKSLVWYSKKAFADAGYSVPTTWDEMIALAEKIKADGKAPFCVSIESASATGWVVTDYVENVLLRTAPLDVYDQWTTNEVKFTDPRVKAAWEKVGQILNTPGYAYGGPGTMLTTPWTDGGAWLFTDPPKCYMFMQGSFATGAFPDEVKADLATYAGSFTVPQIDAQYGAPLLVVGELVSVFKDSPEARAFLEWILLPDAAVAWNQGDDAMVFTGKSTPPSVYTSDFWRQQAETVLGASAFRYDGSDMMPGAVGTGSFWKGGVDFIQNPAQLDEILKTIDASWPAQ